MSRIPQKQHNPRHESSGPPILQERMPQAIEMARLLPTNIDTLMKANFPRRTAKPTMCPLCGESLMGAFYKRTTRPHNPLTGECNNTNICTKRREELDNETIEFLGLMPRLENDSDQQHDM